MMITSKVNQQLRGSFNVVAGCFFSVVKRRKRTSEKLSPGDVVPFCALSQDGEFPILPMPSNCLDESFKMETQAQPAHVAADYLTGGRRCSVTPFTQTETMGRERLNHYITDSAIIVEFENETPTKTVRLNLKRFLEESDLLRKDLSPTPTIKIIKTHVLNLKTAHKKAEGVDILNVLKFYLENNAFTLTKPDETITITEVLNRCLKVYKFAEDFDMPNFQNAIIDYLQDAFPPNLHRGVGLDTLDTNTLEKRPAWFRMLLRYVLAWVHVDPLDENSLREKDKEFLLQFLLEVARIHGESN